MLFQKTPWIRLMTLTSTLISSAIFSQNNTAGDFPVTLYVFNSYGEISRYDEGNNRFLITEERECYDENDAIRIDTLLIKEKIHNQNYIIARTGSNRVGLMQREIIVPDSIYAMAIPFQAESLEAVKKKFQESPELPWKSLLSRPLFTKAKIEVLKGAPGLDQITREHLIESLSWRKAIGDQLKSYLDTDTNVNQSRIYRMVENYRNQKLLMLGYNPYKQVTFNWQKQFQGDEEVMELLTEPISFD